MIQRSANKTPFSTFALSFWFSRTGWDYGDMVVLSHLRVGAIED